jgi:hypothetical protein
MPWSDFERGEIVELDDEQVTPRVKELFECLNPDGKTTKSESDDPDINVMVARLKAAKVPLKKNMTNEKIRELFDEFLGRGATAGSVSGETDEEPSKEKEPPREDAGEKPDEDK